MEYRSFLIMLDFLLKKKIEDEMLTAKKRAVTQYKESFEKELGGSFLSDSSLKNAHSRIMKAAIDSVNFLFVRFLIFQ